MCRHRIQSLTYTDKHRRRNWTTTTQHQPTDFCLHLVFLIPFACTTQNVSLVLCVVLSNFYQSSPNCCISIFFLHYAHNLTKLRKWLWRIKSLLCVLGFTQNLCSFISLKVKIYIYIYVYFDKEGLFIYYCESDDSYEVQVKPPSITEIWLISIIFTLEVLYYLS